MWKLFQDYRDWVKNNPILIEDYVGKDAVRVMREKPRCLTMEGFDNYLFEKDILDGVQNYFANTNDAYTDFLSICSRIKQAIREDQISGGMAGIYNPSITQRLNGLVDKTESKVTVEQPLFDDSEG